MIKLQLLKIKLQGRLRYNIFVGLAALSVIGINIYDLFFTDNDIAWNIFSYVLITGAALLLAFNVYFIRAAAIDLKLLKNNKFEKINAKFLSFQSRQASNKGLNKIVYTGQKFRNLDNDEIIQIDVEDVELKESYVIAYAKYSKIGIVIQKYKLENKKA